MKLLSIDYIPGTEIEALGMVKGTVVQTKNVGRDFMAGMKTLVGGEIVGYTEMLNEARQIAVKRMVDEAKELDADFLIILTAVEKAAINYGKPGEKWLDDITVDEAKQYIEEGHFAPGSMLPKVQAAVEFAESKPRRQALITLLEKARDGILGKTGTRIHL